MIDDFFDLSRTQIWQISAEILHSSTYRQNYIEVLGKIITSKSALVLDTACGTGFPSLDLLKQGYSNITCVDADREMLAIFERKVNLQGIIPKIIVSCWQDLNLKVFDVYDIVLNCENSFVYLDTWNNDQGMASTENEIFTRMRQVLKNFYGCLSPSGKMVIGLAKNNQKNFNEATIELGTTDYKGKKVNVLWKLYYNWSTRIKTSVIVTGFDGKEVTVPYKSYLIDRQELAALMREVGFNQVEVVSVDDIYDDLLIGSK